MRPTAAIVPTLHAEAPDGVLVAYRVHGGADADDGRPPVLLVHGFASTAAVTWDGTGWIRALRQAGRAVITLDLRGHGDSDKPVDAASYDPARLGDDVVAVLDSAGADVVDVIAYSMGNRVLSAFATAAPERARRAVVAGAGPNELFATWDLDEARAYLLDGVEPRNRLIAQVLGPALKAGADPEALLACIAGVAGADLVLPDGMPALFVAGADDPVPAGVDEFARARGSELLVVPDRDHISTLTARAFKDAAIGFLA